MFPGADDNACKHYLEKKVKIIDTDSWFIFQEKRLKWVLGGDSMSPSDAILLC